MHVMIFERTMSGHHAGYLAEISRCFLRKGAHVTIAIAKDEVANPVLKELIVHGGEQITLHTYSALEYDLMVGKRAWLITRELGLRRLLKRVYISVAANLAVDYVFLPYADGCLYSIALLGSPFGSTCWSGICMRPVFHLRKCGVSFPRSLFVEPIKEMLFMRLVRSRRLRHLFSIDELLVRYVKNKNEVTRLSFAPDPCDTTKLINKAEARRQLKLPEHALVILVFGFLDQRKGLDSLLLSCETLKFPQTAHLLVVGTQSEWAASVLATSSAQKLRATERLHEIDKYVTSDTEALAFSAADVVWLGYRGHYAMSGVLVLAACAGRPVVAAEDGLIGWYVKRYSLGETVNVEDPEQIATAFTALEARLRFVINEPGGQSCFAQNTWDQFLNIVTL
jgi:glycosyltransferase involved in cell wall biosynthesis